MGHLCQTGGCQGVGAEPHITVSPGLGLAVGKGYMETPSLDAPGSTWARVRYGSWQWDVLVA